MPDKKNQKTPLVTYYTKNRDAILAKNRTKKECKNCKKQYSYSYFNNHLCLVESNNNTTLNPLL